MFILVPDLHQSITLAGRRKQRSIGTERHMVDWRCCVALPYALPRLIMSFVLLVVRRLHVAAPNLKCH